VETLTAAIGWLSDPANWQGPDGVIVRMVEHIWLSALALVVALAVAVPTGLYAGHTGRGGNAAINVAGVGRAVPSYALLILFFPIFGFGLVAPLLALVLLAIPPILANVYVGLRGIDRELVEAGRGMGMRESQVLTGVELPAALPVIVAGTRSAAVAIVATATLAALIGGGGLGRLIVDGFALRDEGMLVSGAFLVATLAIVVERGLTLAERRFVSPGVRPRPGAPDYGPPIPAPRSDVILY
jgi:osmoprotectant transport system permease protein